MDRTNTLTMLGQRSGAQPYIELLIGKGKGKIYELSRDRLSIGRSEESDILFPSDAVSRIHALLSKDSGGWTIRDNQSKNGIQVNGSRTDNQRLSSGDLVQVGDFVFRFVDPTMKKAKAPRKVNLAETAPVSFLRVKPSPMWLFATVVVGLGYFLLAPALTPPRVTVKPELVISAPRENSAPQVVTAPPPAVAKPEIAAPVVPPQIVASASTEEGELRPITKEDLAIKTKRAGKKVEPGKSLKIYLEEGQHYLAQGDFDSATIAFNFAILIDPRNTLAIQGMEAAQAGRREISSVASPVSAPVGAEAKTPIPSQEEKKRLVKQLFETANAAILRKKYQKAIDTAEEIRRIELKGETVYLNEAKQIIDQARVRQKDEFEPFVKQANSMIEEKAYRAARELCDQMLKRDESYRAAQECRDRAEKELTRQASAGGAQ
jgi:pSer/pThr/pTyr-binding forkhead associated (FHA) protein